MKSYTIGTKAVGIDIGTHSIKVAALQRRGAAGFSITQVAEARIERPETEKPDHEAVKAAIIKALEEIKIRNDVLVTTISTQRTAVRNVNMPFDDINTVRQIIKTEIEPHLPFPVEQVIVDFFDTGTAEEGKMNALLTAVNKEVLKNHIELAQGAGLEPEVVDVDFMAIYNIVSRLRPDLKEESYLIMDIGASKTTVVYVRNGTPLAVRSIPFAGDVLTQAIAKELAVDSKEAERIKIEQGDALASKEDAQSEQEEKLNSVLHLALERFHRELTRTTRYFSSQIEESDYHRIILTGGSSRLKNIDKYISQALSAPVERLESDEIGECDPAQYAVAVGAGLRGLGECDHPQEFRREEYIYPETLKRVRNHLYAAAGLLGCILIALIVWLFNHTANLDEIHTNLKIDTEVAIKSVNKQTGSKLDIKRMQMELQKLDSEIKLLKGINPSSSLDVLRDFANRIPKEMKVQVNSFNISKNIIEMKGTTSSLEDVYELKQKLEESEYVDKIKDRGTKSKGNRRLFEFRIHLK